jgi:hypothetical protein
MGTPILSLRIAVFLTVNCRGVDFKNVGTSLLGDVQPIFCLLQSAALSSRGGTSNTAPAGLDLLEIRLPYVQQSNPNTSHSLLT